MLVLSRKVSQQILIGEDIRITVLKIDRSQVRLGIEAPRDISILRAELGEVGDRQDCAHAVPDRPHAQTV